MSIVPAGLLYFVWRKGNDNFWIVLLTGLSIFLSVEISFVFKES
jgi:hypothetical protein